MFTSISILFSLLLFMSDIIKLPYCIPTKDKIVAVSAGVRTYREGGIRMEKEARDGKVFYHDYGHGGGGISLAYGCAKHVVNNLFLPQKISKDSPVAVLGSGIIGLTTAWLLTQNGYKVNLYAELVPFERSPDKPEITTTVAAGYWMPLKLANKEKTKEFAVATWNHYAEIEALQRKLNKQLGIEKIRTYSINDDEQLTYMPIEGIIEPKECRVTFGDGKVYSALTFETYVIESEKYLPYVTSLLNASGKFKLVKTKLTTFKQVLTLKETHIFNCLGFGAGEIFSDKNIKGVKGHVFKLKLPRDVANHILFMKVNGQWILNVPQRQTNYLAVGISYEENKSDPFPEKDQVARVLSRNQGFFEGVAKSTTPKPKL